MEKWKVAAYVRLSSDDGDKSESNSITNQKNIINLYLKTQSDLKAKGFYIDDGYTGTDFNRPDFQRLLIDIKNGEINAIIVKDLSRFGRNYIEVGNYLEQIFPLYNIRFIAINDNIDSFKDPTSINNVIVPFKNLMNDEYARDISNKVRSVLTTKKINGEFVGMSAPYGYLKDPNNKHKFIIDKKAASVVKKIFEMILKGKTKAEIVEDLNKSNILTPRLYKINNSTINYKIYDKNSKWNTEIIDRILKNKTYTGDLIQGKRKRVSHKVHKLLHNNYDEWIIVPKHHIPIVSKEKFEQVNDITYGRDNKININKRYDVFTGHLKCGDCYNSLTKTKAKNIEYYHCSSYRRNKSCSKHTVNKSKLNQMVINLLNKQINLIVDLESKINSVLEETVVNYDLEILKNRLNEIHENISKYEHLIETIKTDYDNKYIDRCDYIEYKNAYNDILKTLNQENEKIQLKLEQQVFNSEDTKRWMNIFKKNQSIKELSKNIVDELIDNIYVYETGNIEITFKYKDNYIEAMDFINHHKYDIINEINF